MTTHSYSYQKTSYSLLRRAKDLGDQEAWRQLSEHYERFIYYVLRELNVNPSDLDDVAQQARIILMRDLSKYDRERSRFRTWLKQVIRSTALMHFRKRDSLRGKEAAFAGEMSDEDMEQAPDIDQLIDDEWENYVTSVAMDRLRERFTGKAVDVFELDLEGVSTEAIAAQTGLTVSSVYTLRKRVKRSLLWEVRSVIEELEG